MKRTHAIIIILIVVIICCASVIAITLNNDTKDSSSKVHYTITNFEVYDESPVSSLEKSQDNLHGGVGLIVEDNEDQFIWVYIELTHVWTDGDSVPKYLALEIQYKQTENDVISIGTFYSVFGETYPYEKNNYNSEGLMFLIPVPYVNGMEMMDITYEKLKTQSKNWIEDEIP